MVNCRREVIGDGRFGGIWSKFDIVAVGFSVEADNIMLTAGLDVVDMLIGH